MDLFYVDTAKALLALDTLEGNPTHYVRLPVAGMPFSIYEDADPKEFVAGYKSAYNQSQFKPVRYEKIANGDYSKWYLDRQRALLSEKLSILLQTRNEIRETEREVRETTEMLTDEVLNEYAETLL